MKDLNIKYKIIGIAAALSFITSGLLLLLVKNGKELALGVLLGYGIASLMFWQTERTVKTAVTLSPAAAQRYMFSRYFIRMAVYLAAIFSSIRAEHIHIIGTLLGFLSIKIAVLSAAFWGKQKRI
ncbi:MAG: ATP synthase subunit I [Peptostreptococcaceae bacterium]|nr:ATP synthase subunit I [Peptostreptococcaceae bacterium]